MVFEQYAEADVRMLEGAGHCAAERITDVVVDAIAWITEKTEQTSAPAGTGTHHERERP